MKRVAIILLGFLLLSVSAAWADPAGQKQATDFVRKFYDALIRAGQRPEIHIYSSGGHGFGLKKQGTTSDHWLDDFYNWLDAQGLVKPQ